MRRAGFFFFVFTAIAFPMSVQAERTISLPFELNFDSGNNWTQDLMWVEGTSTGTHITSGGGCWSGGCAKFTPPTRDSDNAAGFGRFTGLNTRRLNIRFLMKIGTTWFSTAREGEEGYGNKLIINMASAGDRPMAILFPHRASPYYYSLAPCDGTICEFQCGGTPNCYWPNGNDTFTIEDGIGLKDYAGQWVCIEHETDLAAGTVKLYIWTLGGELSGLYETQSRTGGGTVTGIDIIGGYYNEYHIADPNTYIMFDELKIDNKFIGPPPGFLVALPSAPTGLRIIP